MPKVSIVMAVYNGMPYLPQAIDSILQQTWADFEFLILDDCSTDDTWAVLQGYSDPRLRLIRQEVNRGQTATLNHGLGLAQGQYIARQDADDLSKPTRLAEQVAFLEAHPDYLMVGTAAELINSRGQVTGQTIHPISDEAIRERFLSDNCFFHGSVMLRRDVVALAGVFREGFRTSQDFDYWLRISESGPVANLPTLLYQYRLHEGQMTFTSYYRMKAEWQFALQLAAIRASGGDDRAAYEAGAAKLNERFAHFIPSPAEQRRALAELWRGKGVAYMTSRKYLPMAYCLLRAFLYEPSNPDFWRGVRNHLPNFS
jgi:glycosyltransferase involved in cell wall biosynthesis